MTENERLNEAMEDFETFCEGKALCVTGEALEIVRTAIKEHQAYRAIGTVEEFKALKEKNTPMELDTHNFQDEPHHYLCPSCRSIVSCTQNYCEECGQALET